LLPNFGDFCSFLPAGHVSPGNDRAVFLSRTVMPYRISIVGHTASSKVPAKPGYGPWELSADRANAVREILAGEGVPSGHIFMVAGKSDTDPLFPDNPSMSPNRRVTITLMREEPPLPTDFSP
jgi:chemotaxis protein MotB